MKKRRNNKTNVVIYQAKNGQIEFRGDFKRDTVWGTQKQIADVFDIDRSVVTRHINKIMLDGEVEQKSNVQKMHIANSDKPVNFYSLDVILALGKGVRKNWTVGIFHQIEGEYPMKRRRRFTVTASSSSLGRLLINDDLINALNKNVLHIERNCSM